MTEAKHIDATDFLFGDERKHKALTIFRRISHRGGQWLGKEMVWSVKPVVLREGLAYPWLASAHNQI
jgi:hypothetical protein